MYIGDRYGETEYISVQRQSALMLAAMEKGAACADWDGRGQFDDELQTGHRGKFTPAAVAARLQTCKSCPIVEQCAKAHPTYSARSPAVAVEGGRLIRWKAQPEEYQPTDQAQQSVQKLIVKLLREGWGEEEICAAVGVTSAEIRLAKDGKVDGVCGENIILNAGARSVNRKGH